MKWDMNIPDLNNINKKKTQDNVLKKDAFELTNSLENGQRLVSSV